jgi:hypothetical protein
VANIFGNSVSVLLGNGDGTFAAKQDYATDEGPLGVAVADFNRDRNPDIVSINAIGNAKTISLLLGNGDGTVKPKIDSNSGTISPSGLVAADLNNDRFPDLVTGGQYANLSVLKNDAAWQTPLPVVEGPRVAQTIASQLKATPVPRPTDITVEVAEASITIPQSTRTRTRHVTVLHTWTDQWFAIDLYCVSLA